MQMFLYDRWEIIGKNIKEMMPERFAKIHDGIIKRYMKSKMKRIIGELRDNAFAQKKNGEEFPVVLKVSELTSATGDMVFIGIVKNISFEQELMKIKDMIANMLPPAISHKLSTGVTEIAEEVQGSVAFVDICSFHSFMSVTSPKDVVKELNKLFRYFDSLCDKFGVEKIKTIGDIYMVACTSGTTTTRVFDYAIRLCEFCWSAIQFTKNESKFHVRAGVGTGNIIQGVLSGSRVSFDIWSDCVNVAARLQKKADPDGIMVCNNTYNHTNFKYDFRINQLEIKGKGIMDCYMLARKKN